MDSFHILNVLLIKAFKSYEMLTIVFQYTIETCEKYNLQF